NHAGHADALEIIENPGRTHDGVVGPDLAGGIARHQRMRENRRLAVMYSQHLYDRLRRTLAPVVPGELAERPFRQQVALPQYAFDHELRMRGNWQTDKLSLRQLD